VQEISIRNNIHFKVDRSWDITNAIRQAALDVDFAKRPASASLLRRSMKLLIGSMPGVASGSAE